MQHHLRVRVSHGVVVLEGASDGVHVLCLDVVVGLGAQHLGELVQQRDRVVPSNTARHTHCELQERTQQSDVDVDLRAHSGPAHLHGHAPTIDEGGSMHLPDRRARDGYEVERRKTLNR